MKTMFGMVVVGGVEGIVSGRIVAGSFQLTHFRDFVFVIDVRGMNERIFMAFLRGQYRPRCRVRVGGQDARGAEHRKEEIGYALRFVVHGDAPGFIAGLGVID